MKTRRTLTLEVHHLTVTTEHSHRVVRTVTRPSSHTNGRTVRYPAVHEESSRRLCSSSRLTRPIRPLPEVIVPQEVFKKNWLVYCKPSAQGPQKLLEYLGRYVHRITLSNTRIVALTNKKVTFSYTDSTSYELSIKPHRLNFPYITGLFNNGFAAAPKRRAARTLSRFG